MPNNVVFELDLGSAITNSHHGLSAVGDVEGSSTGTPKHNGHLLCKIQLWSGSLYIFQCIQGFRWCPKLFNLRWQALVQAFRESNKGRTAVRMLPMSQSLKLKKPSSGFLVLDIFEDWFLILDISYISSTSVRLCSLFTNMDLIGVQECHHLASTVLFRCSLRLLNVRFHKVRSSCVLKMWSHHHGGLLLPVLNNFQTCPVATTQNQFFPGELRHRDQKPANHSKQIDTLPESKDDFGLTSFGEILYSFFFFFNHFPLRKVGEDDAESQGPGSCRWPNSTHPVANWLIKIDWKSSISTYFYSEVHSIWDFWICSALLAVWLWHPAVRLWPDVRLPRGERVPCLFGRSTWKHSEINKTWQTNSWQFVLGVWGTLPGGKSTEINGNGLREIY